jgi:hypothetical protein
VVGRPTKRTPEREQRLLDALSAGNTIRHACLYADISDVTFDNWRKDLAFLAKVQKAEAAAIVRHVANIAKAATDGQWQASAWWLERRYPEHYGRRFEPDSTVTTAMQVTVMFDHATTDTDQTRQTTLELPAAD